MLGIHDFGLFFISALLLNVAPGPDTAYVVARSLQTGWRGGVAATVGVTFWPAILGLVLGGVMAAPLGALIAKHGNERALRVVVGVVVCALSVRGLLAVMN